MILKEFLESHKLLLETIEANSRVLISFLCTSPAHNNDNDDSGIWTSKSIHLLASNDYYTLVRV